jgi:hypothetical protein
MLQAFIASLVIFTTLITAEARTTQCSEASRETGIDYDILETCLMKDGVEMEVHGAVPMSSMFVVTYRNPNNFFQSVHLSLLGATQSQREFIKTLKRHDVVLVKGEYADIPVPQRHVQATTVQLLSRSSEAPHSEEYTYEALPDQILAMKKLTGKVHAVFGDGRVMVIEYKDLVVPVYVGAKWASDVAKLSRGDKIEINYVVQAGPRRPVHVNLDPAAPFAFRVLHSVTAQHGKETTMKGKLIMFPKSPMVMFPVFAIDVDMGDGVMLPHTVLSFTDAELFKLARQKFQAEWDRHPETVRQYRNKFINDGIEVTVSGTYNMIDPLQANPQLVIKTLNDIQFNP